MTTRAPGQPIEIVIIGAGHSGLCVGSQLARAGFHRYTILEKASRLGGTWRDNTYPGAACDSPATAYCYSFHPKADWSRKWAPQTELLRYQEETAQQLGVVPHIRFDTEVTSARFDAHTSRWTITTAAGDELGADVLISAVGQLSRPRIPDIPGLDSFAGPRFHSARWDHGVDLRGKRVGIVGSAASAVQIVPAIVDDVASLHVFQRSANWIFPKNDRVYPAWEKSLYRRLPPLARLYRWWLWLTYEIRFPVLRQNRYLTEKAREQAREHLESQVSDPRLREQLTPDYPLGAKRMLISDDYYPALARGHVNVVTDAIVRVDADAVVTEDGARHECDVLVLATGFDTTDFLAPMRVEGTAGRTLDEAWRDGAEAYLGVAVSGFPNLFLMYGPNTNLGHNSIIFMIECQTRYIVDCVRQMDREHLSQVDVRPEVQEAYNREVQERLSRTVWGQVESSWYQNEAGRITNNWPDSTIAYWRATRRADLSRFEVKHIPPGSRR